MGQTFQFHEAANIFPIDEEGLQSLADDIRKNGQRMPIEIAEGKVLDGRRRVAACQIAGVVPRTVTVSPSDPIAYVLSLNLHRRHLTPSQLAMVGARAREVYDREAKERQKRKSVREKSVGTNLSEQIAEGRSRDAVGKAVGVSGMSIDHATRVIERAEPEVVKAVDEGRMAVSTAALLATEPPEIQRQEAANPKRNRTYQSVSKSPGEKAKKSEERAANAPQPGERQGVGVIRANEAINCLMRIPKNDALRKRGFQLVTDWIKHNK